MTSLTSLDLSVPMTANDMWLLSALTGLTCLTLRDIGIVVDATPLVSLTGLTSLTLHDCSGLSSTTAFTSLTALKTLIVDDFSELDDEGVREVSRLTSLTTFRFTGNLTGLRGNGLSDRFVESLSHMTGLTSLGLPMPPFMRLGAVTRVGYLSRLTSLTSLELRGKYLVDGIMVALSCMPLLTSLDLSYNSFINQVTNGQVQTLALPPLTYLTSLSLSCCRNLTDEAVAALVAPFKTSLTSLDLSLNTMNNLYVALGLRGTQTFWRIDLRWTEGTRLCDRFLWIDGQPQYWIDDLLRNIG
jgi:hypothetical protein